MPQDLNTLNADFWPFCRRFSGKRDYKKTTEGVLPELETLGYRMPTKKAQLCTSEAAYLGTQLEEAKKRLPQSRTAAIPQISTPKAKRQVQSF